MAFGSVSLKRIACRQGLSRDVLRQALADLPIRLERYLLDGKTAGLGLFYSEELGEMFRDDVRTKYPEAFGCIDDYVRQNRRRAALERKFGYITQVGLKVDPRLEELRGIGWRTWWDEFHKKFPNVAGTVSVSAVGFSSDCCYAMISVSSGVGSLHSSGGTYLYRREDEKWTLVDVIGRWMS